MVVKISNYYVTYLCCWVYCFNFVLDVVGVLVVAVVVDHGRGDIDGGGGVGGPSGDSSTTGRMPLLLLVVDDDVPVRLG